MTKICQGKDGKESQFIFKDNQYKSRLKHTDLDWYVAEYKDAKDEKAQWFPWIAGRATYLQLSENERAWAIKSY